MTMEITRIAENDDRLLLHLQGRLDIAGAGEIETRLYALVNGAAKPVILDFSGVSFLSSMGIRLIISCWKMVKHGGYPLHLAGCTSDVEQVIRIAGLGELLA